MSGWWSPLFGSCTGGEKPGGLALTQHAAARCGFGASSRLLDVAAGAGETVRFLRRTLGCQAVGLDSDPSRHSGDVVPGRAEALPFPAAAFDGVLLECALSQIEQPDSALAECARVLCASGFLVLSDLYARRGSGPVQTPLGRLDSRKSLEYRLRRAGLEPVLFEDHSRALTDLWAGAVLSGTACTVPLRGPDWPEDLRCGYYLCTAQKLRE
ncbi:MAG: class I SAM-dependent methyltransferase [Lawsonibacter sp.]|nr:class I SAM-dependent methyltransferase [Lawsonibacter sp.]